MSKSNTSSSCRGSKNELRIVLYINGTEVQRLSDDQKDSLAVNLSKAMSRYYSDRPEEYIKLQKGVTTCL